MKCPLCTGSEHEQLYDLSRVSSPLSIAGEVVRCIACGMCFKKPSNPEAVLEAYGGDYGVSGSATEYYDNEAAQELFTGALRGLAGQPGSGRPRLLDIGTGPGILLQVAKDLGFDAIGIDVCQSHVERAQAAGLDVRRAMSGDLTDDGTYDVVTMMDVIEHVTDPLDLLADAHRLLRPGGELLVYTPNHRAAVVLAAQAMYRLGIRNPVQEIFGSNHVCFFDDQTLTTMLEKAGFSMRRLELSPYDPRRPGQPISAVALVAVTALEQMGRPFRRMFRLSAYATRP